MVRTCLSPSFNASFLRSLIAVGFSLFVTVDAVPVVAADGDLDTSFGTGGKVVTSILSQDDFAHSVAIQSDGKIVVAGETKNGTADEFALARYNADGTLDTSFGNAGGKVITNSANNSEHAYSLAIQSDGKILLAGASGNAGDSVAIQSDGKILLAGASDSTGHDDFALYRYNTDGSLDASFGTGGKVVTSFMSQDDIVRSVALQSDGKIVVAGETKNGTYDEFGLARYNSDGTLDTSFDGDGKVITNSNNNGDHAYSVAIQSDGKILLAGASDNTGNDDFALYRYNTDGSLDASFGTGGKVVTAVGGGDDIGTSVAIQSDGKIVVVGHSENGGYYDFALVRYAGTPTASGNATPSVSVPTLPTILLMVLSGLLALFGFYRVRASK